MAKSVRSTKKRRQRSLKRKRLANWEAEKIQTLAKKMDEHLNAAKASGSEEQAPMELVPLHRMAQGTSSDRRKPKVSVEMVVDDVAEVA